MQIFVRTLSGRTIVLDVQPSQSVESLALQIQDKEGIPADQQRLVFNGKELYDDLTLADSEVTAESTVYLNLDLLGGGKKRKKKNYTKPKKEKHKKKKVPLAILQYYKVNENGKITRLRKECRNKTCQSSTFMAVHTINNRYTCGRCGLTLVYSKNEEGADE